MKKTLIKLLSCVIGLCLLISTLAGCEACNTANWKATKMNGWGSVVSVGGFVAETDNYIYYLNGVADSSKDNGYGEPVKGALMVASKSDLSKTEIAVPKLFAASDYQAGVYVFGDYVYYGTPSTEKNSDGAIAKTDMMFRKAKLDGSTDELLFTVNSLSLEYRMVEKNGSVYIVYYDNTESALISYDVSAKKETVIAKKDEKTEGNESLNTYKFLKNEMTGSAVVVYTTTVYSLPYNEDMNTGTETTRTAESYNKVYAYSAGDTLSAGAEVVGKLVYDGSVEDDMFELLNVDKQFVYIKKTEEFGKVSSYAVTANELMAGNAGVEIDNDYATVLTNLVVSVDEAYILPVSDSESESTGPVIIYKDTLKADADHAETKEVVAMCESVNSFLFKHEGYLYYYNSSLEICRINLAKGVDANEERVSESSATGLTSWYAPEIIEINGKDYLFYCDSSSLGLSYVKYVDLSVSVTEEDTDDDGENDKFYLDGAVAIGKMLDSDLASIMKTKISNFKSSLSSGVLEFDKDDDGKYVLENGKLVATEVKELRAEYEGLTKEVKDLVDDTELDNCERAIEIANLLYKLDGIYKISSLDKTSSEYLAFKTAYESIKGVMEEYYESGEYKTINSYIEHNLKANYTIACKEFEPEKK